MQTSFTAAQLRDPDTAEANGVLRRCVHCGFCTATCPTFVLLGDELDSPRGRIYLIKDMLEGGHAATPEVVRHLDRCLSCLSCMTTCPSGVDYGALIDHARNHVERTYRRPWHERLLREALALLLPRPALFRPALQVARLARPLARLVPGRGLPAQRLRAMLNLAPARLPPRSPMQRPQVHQALPQPNVAPTTGVSATLVPGRTAPQGGASVAPKGVDHDVGATAGGVGSVVPGRLGEGVVAPPATPARVDAPAVRPRRVALLTGCAQTVLAPAINESTIRLLTRLGVEVVVAHGVGCCGALTQHMGQEARALATARAALSGWGRECVEEGGEGLDAVVVNTSGCGTTVKGYPHLFRNEPPEWRERAARLAGMALDVSELLMRLDYRPSRPAPGLTVAYHAACSLQHGQRVTRQPRLLLERAGFTVVEPAEAHLCCGSAGTYNIVQPEIAGQLRARKLERLGVLRPDVVAAGNIGCLTQLAGGGLPMAHTVELLDWMAGGPEPEALRAATSRGQGGADREVGAVAAVPA